MIILKSCRYYKYLIISNKDINMLFDELLDKYFLHKNLRIESRKRYIMSVKQLQKYYADIRPEELNIENVLNWRHHLVVLKKISPVTWNHYVRHLRALINFANDNKLLPACTTQNPFKNVLLREPKKKKKTLTSKELKYAKDFIINQKEKEEKSGDSKCYPAWFWLTVFETFKYTGIRLNQLLHFRLCDFDKRAKVLHIIMDGSKSYKEYSVPISADLYPLLINLYDNVLIELNKKTSEQLEHLCVLSKDGVINKSNIQLFNVNLFSTRHKGLKMDSNQVEHFFTKLGKQCKFKISPHRFRHTIATELMKSPERNLYLVKELLGHSSLDITMQYIEPDIEQIRNIIEYNIT